jgi:hypothetical protein
MADPLKSGDAKLWRLPRISKDIRHASPAAERTPDMEWPNA